MKEIIEEKKRLANIVMTILDTDEDKRIKVNSSQCHEGKEEGKRQVKIDITTTVEMAEYLRKTSGAKALFQCTPGHDKVQKEKDNREEKWERLETTVSRDEAWEKTKQRPSENIGLQLAHDGVTLFMRALKRPTTNSANNGKSDGDECYGAEK